MIKRIIHALAALILVTTSGMATAAPEGGNIVGGSGSIDKQGNKTTITQNSEKLVVDWDSFNVTKTEHVHFKQQNTTDAALNRIYSTRPSEIWGQITGKGNIWLLNPNGVIFGKTAKVKTGNLVAAGMWMSKQDFMSGRYVLNNQRGTGDVSNAGKIEARNIGLAGANINNSGTIRAKAGKVSLASGEKMTVDFAGDRLLGFVTDKIPGKETSIENSGSIEAEEVSISIGTAKDIYGGVINTTGVIRATATDKTGGVIDLVAAEIKQSGNINTDGTTGGEVTITADKKVTLSGSISAKGDTATGGSIRATADTTELTATASIDASGEAGGGEALIGGGWKGQDKSIENAKNTRVQKGAEIKANATSTGDGGTIVVWSDNTTTFYGDIEATGGKTQGNGGKAEVSGREHLLMRGTADLRATNGKTGTLLLDPGTVRICDGDTTGCANAPDPPRVDDPATMGIDESQLDTFTDAYIQTQLGMSDLTIATSNAGTTNGAAEDINVESGVSIIWNANALTLVAGNDININAGSTLGGVGSVLDLYAGNDLTIGGTIDAQGAGIFSVARDIIFSSSMDVDGSGELRIEAGRDISSSDTFTIDGTGSMTVSAGRDINLTGTWDSLGSGTLIIGAVRNVNLDGTFNARGMGGTLTIGAFGNVNIRGMFPATGSGTLNINAATDINIEGAFTATGTGTLGLNFNNAISLGRDATLEGIITATGFTSTNTLDLSGRNDGLNISLTAISNITPPPVEPGQMPLNPTGFDGQITIGDGTLNFLGINTITGSSQTDTITGLNADSTWTLGDTDSYTSGTQTMMFSALENIQGGSMADTFTINGAHTGDIKGGAGTDSITGLNADSTWTLGDTDSYTSGTQTITFSALENIQGGSMADTFTINGIHTGNIKGGAGNDTFTLTAVVRGDLAGGAGNDTFNLDTGGSVRGIVYGGTGTDTLSYANRSTTVQAAVNSGAGSMGFQGSATNTRGFFGIDTITAGTGSNNTFTGNSEGTISGNEYSVSSQTLTVNDFDTINAAPGTTIKVEGTDVATIWTITGNGNMVTEDPTGGTTRTFMNVGSIQGGSMMDTFNINTDTDVSVLLVLNGGAGNDEFNLNAVLYGHINGEAGADTITFNANGGIARVNRTGGTVDGGAGADIFKLNEGAVATGTLRGGADSASLDFSDVSSPINIKLHGTLNTTGFSGKVTGGAAVTAFSGINNITGGDGTDTLAGSDEIWGSWTLGDTDSYASNDASNTSRTLTFSALENMRVREPGSGRRNDTFNINGAHTGDIYGNGFDFDFGDGASVTGDIYGNTFDFLRGASVTITGNIYGGAGFDFFAFNDGASVTITGDIYGGAGGDSFDFRGGASVTITGDIYGGAGRDYFDFRGGASVTITGDIYGGSGRDDFYFRGGASVTGDIYGGAGGDRFDFGDGASVTGEINGEAGIDIIGFSTSNDLAVVLSGMPDSTGFSGTVSGGATATFSGVYVIDGGTGTDTLTGLDADSTWSLVSSNGVVFYAGYGVLFQGFEILNGGSGTDTFDINGVYSSITGGGGADVFNLGAGGSVSGMIAGGAGADVFNLGAGGSVSGMIAGGAGADVFNLGTGGSVSGMINGGTGADTLSYATRNTMVQVEIDTGATMAGFSGTATDTGGFSGINTITASSIDSNSFTAASDGMLSGTQYTAGGFTLTVNGFDTIDSSSITGTDVNTTWVINSNTILEQIGGVTVRTHTGVRNIHGGSMEDTFRVTGDTVSTVFLTLNGGGGADEFVLNAVLYGHINGEAGADTVTFNAGGGINAVTQYFASVDGGSGQDIFEFSEGALVFGGLVLRGGEDSASLDFSDVTSAVDIVLYGISGATGYHGVLYSGTAGGVSFDGVNNIVGGSGVDTLFGLYNRVSDWTLGATDSYASRDASNTTRTMTFSALENMRGGSLANTFNINGAHTDDIYGGAGFDFFVFNDGASVTGDIYSGAGEDSFDFYDGASVTITGDIYGGAGNDSFDFGDGASVTITGDIYGGAGRDDFDFRGGASVTITGDIYGGSGRDDFYFRGGASVTGDIYGGSGVDRFNFGVSMTITGDIYGGAGGDRFDFGDGASVTGEINGEAGIDIIGFNTTGSLAVVLSGMPDSTGFSGTVSGGATATFSGVYVIDGGTGTDTLTGLDADSSWSLDASDGFNTYRVNSGGETLRFFRFEALNGGSGADTFDVNGVYSGSIAGDAGADVFNLGSAGSVTGMIDGDAGADVLSYATRNTMVQVEIDTGATSSGFSATTATGTGGFADIDVVTAGTASDNSFTGASDGTLSGNQYTAGGFTLTVNGFNTMGSMPGSSMMVVGTDVNTTWVISGNTIIERPDGGTERTYMDMDINNIRGGSMVDRFEITGDTVSSILLVLDGGAGADVFVLDAILYGQINGQDGADVVMFNSGGGIAAVGGMGGGVDGGAGDDRFDFNGGTVAGAVVGGADSASLDFAGVSGALNIGLSGVPGSTGFSGSVSGGVTVSSFSGVDTITGGSGTDALAGLNADATWNLGASDSYVSNDSGGVARTLAFSSVETFIAGARADTFNISRAYTGSLDGGAGDDIFNLNTGGSVSGGITGGAGADTFDFNGGVVTGAVVGGGDDDALDFSGTSDELAIYLTGTSVSDGFAGTVYDPNSFTVVSTFTGINTIIGSSSDNDTLAGLDDVDATWNLDTSDSYESGGETLMFSSLETFTAGAMADTFNISRAYTGSLDGGAGDDVFNLNTGGSVSGGITGGAGDDMFDFNGGTVAGAVVGGADSASLDFSGVSGALNIGLSGVGSDGFSGSVSGGVAVSSFSGVDSITGGSGTDTLAGLDADATWNLGASDSYVSNDGGGVARTLAFSSVETFTAGARADTFNISRTYTGSLDGGAGADTFNVAAVVTGSMAGEGGNDLFALDIGGNVTGTVDGGADDDTFDFNGGTVGIAVAGGGDTDTLDFADITANLTISLTGASFGEGFAGSVSGYTFSFSGMDEIAGSGDDTLVGSDNYPTSTWTLGSSNSYAVFDTFNNRTDTLVFVGFENLNGGIGSDTFNVNGAYRGGLYSRLNGGMGNDIFNINVGGSVGSINGDADNDTFNIAGGRVTVGGDVVNGGDGADTFILSNGGSVAGNITGGAGADTITVNVGSSVSQIRGNDGADTFNIASGSITGDFFRRGISGGDGADIFNIEGGSVPMGSRSVTIRGDAGADIFNITVGRVIETIRGDDGDNIFNIERGGIAGDINGGFEADTFNIADGSVVGNINGYGGNDTLSYAARNSMVTVTVAANPVAAGFSGTATDTGGFVGIDVITAGTASDNSFTGASDGTLSGNQYTAGGHTLTINGFNTMGSIPGSSMMVVGTDVNTTWVINGNTVIERPDGGAERTYMDMDINNIRGGSMVDRFEITGDTVSSILLVLDGGAGADEFVLDAILYGQINGQDGADVVMFNSGGGIAAVGGMGGGVDGMGGGVDGGAGDDTFDFNGGTVAGTVAGGADDDTLDFAGTSDALTVSLSMAGAAGFSGNVAGGSVSMFTGIDTIVGSSATDTLAGLNADATWNLDTSDSYVSNDGGGVARTLAFSSIETFTAGSMADTFNISRAYTGSLDGGAGADTFNLNTGGSVSGDITGDAGSDTLSYAARSTAVQVAVNAGAGVLGFSGDATDIAGDFTGIDVVTAAGVTGNSFTGAADGMLSGNSYTAGGFTLTVNGFDTIRSSSIMGTNVDTTWVINGSTVIERPDGGAERTYMDMDINNIRGGSMVDRFEITGDTVSSILLVLDGGGGADEFVLDAVLYGQINGQDGADVVMFNPGGGIAAVGGMGGGVDGGAGDDMFDFNGGTVAGAVVGGADSASLDFAGVSGALNIGLSGVPAAAGFSGSVSGGVTVSSFSGVDTITGGSGTDALAGLNADATWNLGASDSYVSNDGGGVARTLAFSSVETFTAGSMADTFDISRAYTGSLDGGMGDDTFNLNTGGSVSGGITGGVGSDAFDFNGGTVAGTVAGGADDDTLDFAGTSDALTVSLSLVGTAGFDGGVTGGPVSMFTGINTLGGSSAGDTLVGLNADATWNLGASDSYVSNDGGGVARTLVFSSVETFTAGAMADAFDISRAYTGSLDGGMGDDTFNLNTGGSVTGSITGGAGVDTFDFNGGTVAGTVIGGADDDTLDFAGTSDALTVALSMVGTAGFDGSVTGGAVSMFTGIDSITGSSTADTLTGLDADATWNLDASDSYVSGQTLTFSSFETLTAGTGVDTFNVERTFTGSLDGGAGDDVFNLNTGGSVSGGIDGGAGADVFDFNGGTVAGTVVGGADADTLDFAGISAALTVSLSTAGTAGFAGSVSDGATVSFTGVNDITGGGGTDTLTGIAADATWTLGSSDSYAAGGETLMFSGLENIQGGGAVDTFMIGGAHSGDLLGGAGADVFTVAAAVTGSVSGEAGADSFTLNSGGSVSGDVTGGAGADSFVFAGGVVSGAVAGGVGADVIDFSALSSGVAVALSAVPDAGSGTVAGAVGYSGYTSGGVTLGDSVTAGFSGIDRIVGSGGTGDSFTGLTEAGTYTFGGSAGNLADIYWVDAVTVGGSPLALNLDGIESLVSAGQSDSYVINREYTGDIVGGTGSNTVTVNAALTGNIMTGAGDDHITVAAVVTGNVDADGGNDVLVLNGGRIGGMVSLGEDTADTDTLDVSGHSIAITIVYSQSGAMAYTEDDTYGTDADDMPDMVIGGDGHGDGTMYGMYGAEVLMGAAHNPGAGTGTYLVVQPEGDQYGADLVINGGPVSSSGLVRNVDSTVALELPELDEFAGAVVLGGSDAPSLPTSSGGTAPLPLSLPPVVNTEGDMVERAVQARSLVIAGDVAVGGSLALLGSGVSLQADVSAGMADTAATTGGLAIVATGGSEADFEGNGNIETVLAPGEAERSISADSALIVASGTFSRSASTSVNLGTGSLEFAQGEEGTVSFSTDSTFTGTTLSEETREYVTADLGLTAINLDTVLQSVSADPASEFIQSASLYVDPGLIEEELTLFSLVGKGISLYLSLCEEIEGCAPPVNLEEIDTLLQKARERLQQLQSDVDAAIETIRRFEKAIRDLVNLRREFVEIFGEGNITPDNKVFEVSVPPWEYTRLAQAEADTCSTRVVPCT